MCEGFSASRRGKSLCIHAKPAVPAIMRCSKKLQCQLWPFLSRTRYSWLSLCCVAQSANTTCGSTRASLQLHQPALLWSCVVAGLTEANLWRFRAPDQAAPCTKLERKLFFSVFSSQYFWDCNWISVVWGSVSLLRPSLCSLISAFTFYQQT